ncbi:hypothetical protein MMC18_002364 [Xylographa bjoerkii]|nr:hypothetical protein [Xylographa bjoerkii]
MARTFDGRQVRDHRPGQEIDLLHLSHPSPCPCVPYPTLAVASSHRTSTPPVAILPHRTTGRLAVGEAGLRQAARGILEAFELRLDNSGSRHDSTAIWFMAAVLLEDVSTCDETLPACSLCVRRKLVCPGYRDDFDLVLRDQTQALQQRGTRKHNKKDTVSGRSPSDNNLSNALIIQRRSTLPGCTEFIPSALKVTPEELAISSWFDSFILLYRDQESRRGYLEYLLPLYTSARHDSPLSLATSALAMIVFSGPPSHRPMMDMALKVFGESMTLTRKALQSPVDSKNDQTLMAVLLLSMAEGLLAMANGTIPSGAHAQGAIALVKHRGMDNFKSDISQRLFIAVQTQMIGYAVQHSAPIEKLPEEFAEHIKALPSNAATRLTALEAEVANLLASARLAFGPDQIVSQSELFELSSSASELDEKLHHWAESVPQQWNPLPAKDNSSAALAKFQAYGSRMDIYPEVWVVSIWNSYRILHIAVQEAIACCAVAVGIIDQMPGSTNYRIQDHTEVGQRLVDDICGSIPYCLGSRVKHEAGSEIDYPFASGSSVTNDHRKAAKALGVWFVLGSLNACLGVRGIEDDQMRWIRSQLSRVKGFYNLDQRLSPEDQALPGRHGGLQPSSGRSYCLTRISQPDAQLLVPQFGVPESLSRRRKTNGAVPLSQYGQRP